MLERLRTAPRPPWKFIANWLRYQRSVPPVNRDFFKLTHYPTPNPRASKQTTFERYLGHAQRKSDTPGTTERTREYYRQDSDAI